MLSPTYHLRGDYHTRAYEHVKSLPRSRRLRPAGGLPYTLLRNLLRLLALRPVCGAPRFDRNLTAIGCLSLSLPVPLRETVSDKSAVLSLPVPHCPSLSPPVLKQVWLRIRRSQVRVLPSALRKPCTQVIFCCRFSLFRLAFSGSDVFSSGLALTPQRGCARP